jgi:4-amino-4-deoxy-L-arabinose transferase
MRKAHLAVILIFVALYLLPLGARPLMTPDEVRYAELAREMVTSGDWVVPRLNGIRYFEKPILGYWVNALALGAFGENAFAARLPQAISVGLTALIIFWLVRRFTHDQEAPLVAALVYITFFMVMVIGTINILDSLLALFLTAALAGFLVAHRQPAGLGRILWQVATGTACGLAFLTKGFLAFAILGLVIGAFLLWERRWKAMFTLPWIPLITAALVALPWSVAIALREGDYWHYFFWIQHVQRYVASSAAEHPEPFWHLAPFLVLGSLPWTVFAPAAFRGLRQAGLGSPLSRFALCWLVLPFLLFSASSGKRGTYILPCFPALAILMALGLLHALRQERSNAFARGTLLTSIIALMGAAWLLMTQISGLTEEPPYPAGQAWQWLVTVTTFVAWGVIALLAGRGRRLTSRLLAFGAAPAVLLIALQITLPLGEGRRHRAPVATLQDHADWIAPGTVIVTDRELVHAVCWAYKRDNVYMFREPGELEYGLKYDDAKHRLLTDESLGELVARQESRGGVLFIYQAGRYDDSLEQLPPVHRQDLDRDVQFIRY